MLFSYSPRGLNQNWLNSTVLEILAAGFDAIDARRVPEAWPNSIPVARRKNLSGRSGIKKRLNVLFATYRGLSPAQRTALREAIRQQTDQPNILSNDGPCTAISALPPEIGTAADELFRFMFDQLATLKIGGQSIRDIQYSNIYNALHVRICPYCGLNYLRAPGAPRHDLDHFLPISRYPFVGSDLRNLPPVCSECNSRYKRDTDVLFENSGARRRCSDPYAGPVYGVQLTGSELFEGNEVRGFRLPRWAVTFVGGPPEQAGTWDTIFKIRERYVRDILDADFLSWIGHFSVWVVHELGHGRSPEDVAATLPRYIDGVIQDGLADRAFLKAEAFRLLQAECANPIRGQDLRQWLWAFVEYYA